MLLPYRFLFLFLLLFTLANRASAAHHEIYTESNFENLLRVGIDTILAEKINGQLIAAHVEMVNSKEDEKTNALIYWADTAQNPNLKVLVYSIIAEKLISYRFSPYGIELLAKAEKIIYNEQCLPFSEAVFYRTNAQIKSYLNKPFSEVLHCWDLSLEKSYQLADTSVIALILYLKAEYFYFSNEFDSAKVILKQVLQEFPEKLKLRNRLNADNILGLMDMKQKKYDQSLLHFKSALHFATLNNDTAWMGILNGNIGQVYYLNNDFKQALEHFKKDICFSKIETEFSSAANACIGLGEIFYDYYHQPDSTQYYFDEAISLAAQYHQHQALASIYEKLEKFYADRQLYKSAYFFKNKLLTYNDSIKPFEKLIQLEENENKRRLEKKDFEIRLLEKESLLQKANAQKNKIGLIMMSVILLLLLLFVGVGFRFYKIRTDDNKKIKSQNEAILQQTRELEKLNDLKDKILALLSHDIRAPLASLKSLLDLYYSEDLSQEENKKLLKNVSLEIERVSFVMENVMHWTQIQLSRFEGRVLQKTDLKKLVAQTFTFLEKQANEKKIMLQCAVEKNFIVAADDELMTIVLRNIIVNAIKFSPPNSRVTVASKHENKNVIIEISDQGIGMKEAQINAFNSGSALQRNSGTSGEKGVGIGLWLCSNIVKNYSGTLTVKSNAPENGVTFSIQFPILDFA